MFTYETIEETRNYLEKLFCEKILPQYSDLPEDAEVDRVFLCFDFPRELAAHIIQKELGAAVEPKSLDDTVSYIELDSRDKLLRSANEPPVFLDSGKDGILAKTACGNLIRLFRNEYNIPFYYIGLTVIRGEPRLRLSNPTIGIPEDASPGFFYRADLDFAPRSSWEANFARVLNDKGIGYRYEREAISVKLKRDGGELPGLYVPDFVLDDGSVVEVKGYWDMGSRDKCAFFAKMYGDRPFYLFDADFYVSLWRRYSDVIPEWEGKKAVSAYGNVVQIVGIGYGSRSDVVRKLNVGENVSLVRDRENKFDGNAILAVTQSGGEIGFVSSDWAVIYAPKIDMGMAFSATVTDIQAKKVEIKVVRTNPEEIILPDFLK